MVYVDGKGSVGMWWILVVEWVGKIVGKIWRTREKVVGEIEEWEEWLGLKGYWR